MRHKLQGAAKGAFKGTAAASVTRGPVSWAYIYIALGFAIAIEGTIIGMITPLVFPWNLIIYAIVILATGWLFLGSGWFQNKLILAKNKYENKPR